MVPDGSVDGIDISEEMVSAARIRFRDVIDSGRMRLHYGNAAALPFPDASFDKVCAVNTVYFWEDLGPIFDELFRVIRPGGRLVIGFTPPDVIRHAGLDLFGFTPYSADELSAAMTSHGFSSCTLQSDADMRGQCFTLSATRRADGSAVESSGS
jgi:arsenite methyltransferase